MRKLAAGNWKMNGLRANLAELARVAEDIAPSARCEIVICPPATLIASAADLAKDRLTIGGQDCHPNPSGAHTGDLSPEMLFDAGARAVILGHSERRADHGETDALVAAKTRAAWRAGLTAIVCVGERLDQREAGETLVVISAQLAASLPEGVTAENTVVAYEPVWAIGSGLIPALSDIAEVHARLRADLTTRFGAATAAGIRLLYGGSVKPANAADVFAQANVDGALVGGASLTAAEFGAIVTALSES